MIASVLILFGQAMLYAWLAPGVVGLLRWFKARLQARRGADIWQPYRDLAKLFWRKQPNIPESASWVFLAAPPVIFVCYLLLGLFLPTFFLGDPLNSAIPWHGLSMDFLFVVYLLGLAKFVSGLAAFDAGASFGGLSSGRQLFVHILAEPVLIMIIYALALSGHSSNLDRLIGYHQNVRAIVGLANLATILILLSLGTVFLVESSRPPFDSPGTHLELTMLEQGSQLEYSGPALALIEWAHALRLTFFLSLLAGLAWPWGMAANTAWPVMVMAVLLYLVKLIFLIFLLTLWEIIQVKLRLQRVVNHLLTVLGLTLVAIVVLTRQLSGG